MAQSHTFRSYIAKRCLYALITLILVLSLNFFMFRVMPGSPAEVIGGVGRYQYEYQLQEVKRQFGLDKPLHEQYFLYIPNFLLGKFGYSFRTGSLVSHEIAQRLPNTLALSGFGIVLAVVFSVLIGPMSAVRYRKNSGKAILIGSLLLYSIPPFWLGIVAIILFAFQFSLFPLGGVMSVPPLEEAIPFMLDYLHHLILPGVCLAVYLMGVFTLVLRSGMIEEMGQDYVFTLRSAGVSTRSITYKHMLRNAMLPWITSIGLNLGFMITGAFLIEVVFSYEGMGSLIIRSIFARDYPVIQAIFFIVAIFVISCNLILDILYGFLDPRIKIAGM